MAPNRTILWLIVTLASMMSSLHAINIVSDPIDVMTKEGNTAELRCSIANKRDFTVYWLRGEQYLTLDYAFYDEASDPRYTISDNGRPNRDFVLRISNVRLTDAGLYRCGYYEPIPTFSDATLTVVENVSPPQGQIPPDEGSPRCEVTPENPSLDGTVILMCISQGGDPPARLTWFEGNNAITGQSVSPNRVDRSLRENLNGIEFRCRLNHPALNSPRFCSVTPLRILPTVRIEPAVVTSGIGQGALYTCVANGIPEIVSYTFLFDGIEVTMRPDANRFAVTRDLRTLTIRDVVAADDNVVIRCDVETTNGLLASATAILRVAGMEPPGNMTTTPAMNATTAPGEGYIGRIKRSNFFIIIIVIGVLIVQLLLVIAVLLAHRALKEKRQKMEKMMDMEWKGVTPGGRNAHELVPTLASMPGVTATAPRRYTQLVQGEVSQNRYQDLEVKSPVAKKISKTSTVEAIEMSIYEGVNAPDELQGNSTPVRHSAALERRTPKGSPGSPRYPPPRPSSAPITAARLPGQDTCPTISSRPQCPEPRGSPRGSPKTVGQRIAFNPSEGVYNRPTSNALSSSFDTDSYQGSVIRRDEQIGTVSYDTPPLDEEQVEPVCYDSPPVEYFEPISDTVYEVNDVQADGYVCPDPAEDPDIDDYEIPPDPTSPTSDPYVPV